MQQYRLVTASHHCRTDIHINDKLNNIVGLEETVSRVTTVNVTGHQHKPLV